MVKKRLLSIPLIIVFLLILPLIYSSVPPGAKKEPGLKVNSYSGYPVVNNPYLQSRIVAMGGGEIQPLIGEGVSPAWKLPVRLGGHVESQKSQETGWSPIWQVRLLRNGDKVRTDSNGYVKVVLADQSWVTFGPNTVVDLSLIQESKKPLSIQLQVTAGALITSWKRFMGKESNFEIQTPNGVIGARGTEYEVKVEDNNTKVSVYDGKVNVKNLYDNKEYIVSEGEQGLFFQDKPPEIKTLSDDEPLSIVMAEDCIEPEFSVSYSNAPPDVTSIEYASMFEDVFNSTGVEEKLVEGLESDLNTSLDIKLDKDSRLKVELNYTVPQNESSYEYKICKLEYNPRPKLVFFPNKILKRSTVNKDTLLVFENGKEVEGMYEVDNTITFIPSRPVFGNLKVVLKGGKKGICSKTGSCLSKDYTFDLKGGEKPQDYKEGVPFELKPTIPLRIEKNLVVTNSGKRVARDVEVSTRPFKTSMPNMFVKFENVSVPLGVEYDVPEGENGLVKFKIKELLPEESLRISINYVALLFGIEYFSRLDVTGFSDYTGLSVSDVFLKPSEGIESDDQRIIDLAKKIVGDEKNPFWKSYKIYEWITTTIDYDYEKLELVEKEKPVRTGAVETLLTGKGICDDYAKLYVALVRAVGIPSRYVSAFVPVGKVEEHAAVEIFLPKYGWIPLDPTWGVEFDNFARQDPVFLPEYKQEETAQPYPYYLSGTDIDSVKVSVHANMTVLEPVSSEDWTLLFKDPFFEDLYKLVLISQIKDYFASFAVHNKMLNKTVFPLPEMPRKNLDVLIKKSIDAYNSNSYGGKLQDDLRSSTIEYLEFSLNSLSKFVEAYKEYLKVRNQNFTYSEETTYTTSLVDGIEKVETVKTEDLLNNLTSELQMIDNLLKEKDYPNAFNSFTKLYKQRNTNLYVLVSNIVTDAIRPEAETGGIPGLNINISSVPELGTGSVVAVLIFLIALPVFWIWMWVNCLVSKGFHHLNKVVWFLLVFFGYIFIPIGAIIYFFTEYLKRNKKEV